MSQVLLSSLEQEFPGKTCKMWRLGRGRTVGIEDNHEVPRCPGKHMALTILSQLWVWGESCSLLGLLFPHL